MKKDSARHSKKQAKPAREVEDELAEEAIDWKPLFQAFRDAFDWALDVAASLARDFPEEVEAIERVRTFVRARLAGRPASVAVDDVLFAFGLLIGAIDRDIGPVSRSSGNLATSPLFFPGSDAWEPRIPRRFIGPGLWRCGVTSNLRAIA
ncbi:MAG TPA: hypothetical protein VFQ53_04615 [Kofleriaceae bacterium]|nr:hypothetical protein [Kofleriaceae bacterium]